MKQLERFREMRSTNCGGPMEAFDVARYCVEHGDVGRVCANYLGYRHRDYKFLPSDVGRVIEQISQGACYTCWYFYKEMPV